MIKIAIIDVGRPMLEDLPEIVKNALSQNFDKIFIVHSSLLGRPVKSKLTDFKLLMHGEAAVISLQTYGLNIGISGKATSLFKHCIPAGRLLSNVFVYSTEDAYNDWFNALTSKFGGGVVVNQLELMELS